MIELSVIRRLVGLVAGATGELSVIRRLVGLVAGATGELSVIRRLLSLPRLLPSVNSVD
jgi:hypothetical protein